MAIKTYRKDSTDKLSENFRASEFACHGTSCGCTTVLVGTGLVDCLQRIREHFWQTCDPLRKQKRLP